MATSSFRLPPPLSSTTTTATNSVPSPNNDSLSSSRTRSLENINSDEKKPPSTSLPTETNGNSKHSNKTTNLQIIGDANLSSSTESTNGIPFANENVGTIKQRSPHNQNNHFYNPSLDPMKRSLPIQFFEQSNTHLLKPSYPMTTTAIYDNNERFISPNKQMRKVSTLTGDQRLQYTQNKVVK
jgi:hypothetical protein